MLGRSPGLSVRRLEGLPLVTLAVGLILVYAAARVLVAGHAESLRCELVDDDVLRIELRDESVSPLFVGGLGWIDAHPERSGDRWIWERPLADLRLRAPGSGERAGVYSVYAGMPGPQSRSCSFKVRVPFEP